MISPLSPKDRAAIAERARRRVETLATEHSSRNGVYPERLERAADFVEQEFRALGFDIQTQEFAGHGRTFRNVIVELPGEQDSTVIVLGAHYDTVIGTPGADDNSTGVAGLLELAGLLKSTPLRHTTLLVAYANEEPPYFHSAHMGSRHHAKLLKESGKNVVLMLALEMLGYVRKDLKQKYPFPGMRWIGRYPETADFISIVGNLRTRSLTSIVRDAMRGGSTIRVESLTAPGFLPPLFLSDHSSYWRQGFPAVMITDTAFLRNPHYHLSSDTPDTLDFDFLADVIGGVYAAVLAVDHSCRR